MNNKIVVLGIVLILMFTINIFSGNSHASLNPVYKLPIIIYNSQNVPTENPFQQLIQLNINTLNKDIASLNVKASIIFNGVGIGRVSQGSGTFANFEFSYQSGQIIPAWIEGNNSGVLLIWLKLSSILAKSSITIYLDIFSSTTNLLSASGTSGIGENPLFSPIYAEYDDGASVFDFYDNFAGKSLNGNNWVYGGTGSIIVNNSVYLDSNKYIYIVTKAGFNPQSSICDVFSTGAYDNANVVFSMTNGNFNYSNGYFWMANAYNPYTNGSYSLAKAFVGNGNGEFMFGNIESESWQSNNEEVYIEDYDYNTIYFNQTISSYPLPSEIYYGIGIQYVPSESGAIQYINVSWIDVRSFSPNGVMPAVYFDVGLNVSVSYPSGNSNQITNNSIIYPQYNATSEDLQFNSQYFSFIIDPLFLFSLLLFLSFIFVIFMAIAIVRKRR